MALDPADPARMRIGGLRYLGGWELSSSDQRFGGLSSMLWRDGRLIALSDAGTVFSIGLVGGVPVGRVVRDVPAGPGSGSDKTRPRLRIADEQPGDAGRCGPASNIITRCGATMPPSPAAEAHAAPPAMAQMAAQRRAGGDDPAGRWPLPDIFGRRQGPGGRHGPAHFRGRSGGAGHALAACRLSRAGRLSRDRRDGAARRTAAAAPSPLQPDGGAFGDARDPRSGDHPARPRGRGARDRPARLAADDRQYGGDRDDAGGGEDDRMDRLRR